MGTQELDEPTDKDKQEQSALINFTLKVSATDLPLADENFKIKLNMDFGPEFGTELTSRTGGPNFHANRVRTILKFVSDDVIRKVVEFIYFKDVYVTDGKPHTLINNEEINNIYRERNRYRQSNPLESKPDLQKEEDIIAKAVNRIIDEDGRNIPIEEKCVAAIRFEELSAGKLSVNVQKIVNGDMPPP
jgi:hypothetical protein